jgi:anaerobic selenocysteine-containing dehydrogenase
MSPDTARERGLVEGRPVRVESAAGAVEVRLRCDGTLPPGCVALAAGPDPAAMHAPSRSSSSGALALGVVEADLTWRGTRVTVREA